MNTALIIAGGVGNRMGAGIPKQFIKDNDKPIIVYSIENFQKNENIENIVVVCVKEWSTQLSEIVRKYKLDKVELIVEGGSCGHDSIRNGIFALKDKLLDSDFVVIHDAVRPILPQKAINELLAVAHKNGNASSSTVCHPPIVYTEDGKSGITDVERDKVMLTASPQAYNYGKVLSLYERAEKENKHFFTFTSSMYIHYGERVYFSKGTTCNIKITTKEDLALFEALLTLPEESLYC